MSDAAIARNNMVECQLETNGIHDERILNVFGEVPRELFVPEEQRGMAYIDEDLPLNDNEAVLMEPVVHARLLQAAEISSEDAALNIGDTCGYGAAVLSCLAKTVVTMTPEPRTLKEAQKIWDDLGYCNIVVVKGDNIKGCPKHAPYDLIIMNGSCAEIPRALLDQLSENGRLVAVVRENPLKTGRGVLCKRIGGTISQCTLFDAATPYISGLEPPEQFEF